MTRKTPLILLLLLLFTASHPALAAEDAPTGPSAAFRVTNLPLPRFVTLSSPEVYVRAGPGPQYPIKWVYRRKGFPVEILLEYETWRKVRDFQGESGWMHQSLISGGRGGIVMGEEQIALRIKPDQGGRLIAYAEPGAIVSLKECRPGWCRAESGGYKGWIDRKNIWGVYENENFD